VISATFSKISAISWRPALAVEEAGIPGENHRPWPNSTMSIPYEACYRNTCTKMYMYTFIFNYLNQTSEVSKKYSVIIYNISLYFFYILDHYILPPPIKLTATI